MCTFFHAIYGIFFQDISEHANNTLDSAFHTINILWRKSVMKLLLLQQQKELRAEQVIMG